MQSTLHPVRTSYQDTANASQYPNPLESLPSPAPQTGLKIGTALTLCIGAVLIIVLGGLSAVQLHRAARRERNTQQTLMSQSLAPLAADIEHAVRLGEIQERLVAFDRAFATRGHPDHHVVLLDMQGSVVAASSPDCVAPPRGALQATIPVEAPTITGGRGRLSVWQDGSRLADELARRRRLAWLDICATLLAVAIGVQLVVHFLVSRPVHKLLISIERTENGYVQPRPITRGARELRWLDWRFRHMSSELTQGAKLLVAAQRQATRLANERREVPKSSKPSDLVIGSQEGRTATNNILRRYLRDRCAFLESFRPGDPDARTDAREAWENGVVEAERLGDMALKARLENAALKVLDPKGFETVRQSLEALPQSSARWIVEVESSLATVLAADQIQCLVIQHRTKHVAGVWRKMQERHLDAGEVHDVFAFRIIVPDRDDCYLALASVHRLFEPEPFRFKDYVEKPKSNGYQSLHTTVRDESNLLFEVQIRSLEMHEAAESGDAAHWRYRAGKTGTPRSRHRRWMP